MMRRTLSSSSPSDAITCDHGRHEPLRGALERRLRQLFLVAEVVVQQRLVDAGLGGDLLHARAGGAAADEHRVGGVEDALLGVAVLLLPVSFFNRFI